MKNRQMEACVFLVSVLGILSVIAITCLLSVNKPAPPTEVQMRIHEGIMDHYDRQEFDPLGLIAEQLEQKREVK